MPARPARLCTVATFLLTLPAAANTVIYVDASAPPGGNGASWTSAFVDLQDALALAADLAGDPDPPSDIQLWIAAGTYKPGTPDDGPESTFNLVSGVALYGGFAGGEESLDERDWETNATVLSGALGNAEGGVVASHTVVTAVGLQDHVILDGLTITGASGEWPSISEYGGGIRSVNSDLLIRNCTIANNIAWIGAGVSIDGGSAGFLNVNITSNWADAGAGGLYANDAAITIADSLIAQNLGMWDAGGAWIVGSSLVMTNTVLTKNAIPDSGGTALFLSQCTAEIKECHVHDNPGNDGHGQAAILANDTTLILHSTSISNNRFYGLSGFNLHATLKDTSIVHNDWGIIGNGSLTLHSSDVTNNYHAGIQFGGTGLITHATVAFNNGGGTNGGIKWSAGELTIANSLIANNIGMGAGGISFSGETLTLVNSVVGGNHNDNPFAGGIRLHGSAVAAIVNSTIHNNSGDGPAGGLSVHGDASATLVNSVVWGNQGYFGHEPQIVGNAEVSFSIIENDEPWPGEGNLNLDPMFIDADGRLSPDSPAIDAGSNELYLAHAPGIDTDLDGNPRIVDGTGDGVAIIDIGAFEFQIPTIPGDLNGDGKVNVEDLLILLSMWGPCEDCTPGNCPADLNNDCNVGVADLLILLSNWTG